jgi:thiamine-phosphate pyrophosphorylase
VRGLYAIVDADALGGDSAEVLSFARAVTDARPAAMQLRAKSWCARQTLGVARTMAQHARDCDVPFFLNDRADLALLCGAYGVHVGQQDLTVEQVRRIAPQLRIGVSTHDDTQLTSALEQRPDYVAFGPVFPTRSKRAPDPVVGVDGLARACARARTAHVPVVAIGGIDLARASAVGALGAGGAVIGALGTDAAAVTAAARALHVALGGAR